MSAPENVYYFLDHPPPENKRPFPTEIARQLTIECNATSRWQSKSCGVGNQSAHVGGNLSAISIAPVGGCLLFTALEDPKTPFTVIAHTL